MLSAGAMVLVGQTAVFADQNIVDGALLYELVDGEAVVTGFKTNPGTTNVEVPATISYQQIQRDVVGIADDAFKGTDAGGVDLSAASNLETIGDSAFQEAEVIGTVGIPDSVVSIGAHAFAEQQSGDFTLNFEVDGNGDNALTEIGESAFEDAIDNTGPFTIPGGVTSLPASVFADNGLDDVELNKVTTVGHSAFKDNAIAALDTDEVVTIEESAFENNALNGFVANDELTTIGAKAFNGNAVASFGFNSVEDSALETIGAEAFAPFTGTAVITFPGSLTSVGEKAFEGNTGNLYFLGDAPEITERDPNGSFGANASTEAHYFSDAAGFDTATDTSGDERWEGYRAVETESSMTITDSDSAFEPGAMVLVTGKAGAGAAVTIKLDGTVLDSVTANSDGEFSKFVTLPNTLDDGDYILTGEYSTNFGGTTVRSMSASFEIAAPAPTPTPGVHFSDVPADHPFGSEIEWLVDEGITTGYDDGTFRPLNKITREAMAAFLYRHAGEPAVTGEHGFNDVTDENIFADAITWAAQEGIPEGYSDGGFHPSSKISREAMAAFLFRYADADATDMVGPFTDVASSKFSDEINWLASEMITTGYGDDTFRPLNKITREATAAWLFRFAN